MRYSESRNRYELLKSVLYKSAPLSFDAICSQLSHRPEWRRKDDTPYPEKMVEREVREIFRNHPADFVRVNSDQWRRRSKSACSFCLTENVPIACKETHFICLQCAEFVVEALREKEFMSNQAAANEAAIMRFEQILGA
jgi:hypothetical protein